MKKTAVSFALVVSLFAVSAAAGEWTGWISTASCVSRSGCAANIEKASHKRCAQMCAKGGIPLVFATEGKALKIENAEKVLDYIGDKVTITGKMEGDTVKIDSVKAAK